MQTRGKHSMMLATFVATAHSLFLSAAQLDADDNAKIEFFEKRIRPVLVEHCYKCHAQSANNIRGGLLLDSKAGILSGGESGPTIVPEHPEDSLLISSLKHESYEMPPDRKLPDSVIADFEHWVRDGAADPREGGTTIQRHQVDLKEGRQFWSFQPVNVPEIPKAGDDWARNNIDRFIAARHLDSGSNVSGDASPGQVLRRLYFGLTGLPPTADEIRDFAARWRTDADVAIADTTNDLLSRRAFGERWGRHWLDIVRFAESSGGGRSLMFPEAWRFRDYTIRSFNNDKPINQLIREHIAGDLLPFVTDAEHDDQVTGVGYLALGPTNYELQDKELLRMEVIDEQIDTIGRSFLGLTLGCARCHDHKFDPIPTADYYALAGIFRSTETLLPGNVSRYVTTKLRTAADSSAIRDWEQQNERLQTQIKHLEKQMKAGHVSVSREINPLDLAGIIIDDSAAVFEGEWTDSSMLAPFVGTRYRHDDYKKTGRRAIFETMLPKHGRYVVRMSHNYQPGRCSRLPVTITHAKGSTTVDVDQRNTPPDGVFATLGTFQFDKDAPAVVTIDAEKSGPGVVIVDAIQFLSADDIEADSNADELRQQTELSIKITELKVELTRHKQKRPVEPVAMGVRDQSEPADWHIHIRGGIRNLGPLVPRGFLTVATGIHEHKAAILNPIPHDRSGRRELADWIASPKNPLTARVFVNRVWTQLIGEGLVRTPDNFGRMGRPPTHPQLLNYLAKTFVDEDQWSVKKLVRRIAASRFYRTSSVTTLTEATNDPDNLLLTRSFRRRLDAEAIRDTILQMSGQLSGQVQGGQTIHEITQYDNGYDHSQHSRSMRSVYVPFFRNSMLELFEVFDIANPNLVTGKRNVSTLPSQALFLLNSPFAMEQSQLSAQHFLLTQSANADSLHTMINEAYLKTVGRAADPHEQHILKQFLAERPIDAVETWTPVFHALLASIDFRYLD